MEKGKDQDKLREECPDSLKRYRSRHIETIMMMMKKNSCSDQRAMEDYKVCKTKCWIFLGFPRNEDAAGDVSEVADEYMIQNGALLLEKQISSGQCGRGTNSEPLKIFLAKEIRQATNGFDRRLVISRVVSTAYKGVLDGRVVAITTPQGLPPCESVINYYLNHITMKQLIHHKNVLKLHGCCLETRVPIYVSEFMSNGSLYHHLHCINVQKNVNAFRISWPDLVRIAMEISHALSYMHCALPKPIVHLDVKSFSIYLDESFTSKLTNFGFSVPLSPGEDVISTVVFGTPGYTDPEYQQTQRVTEKCDVYSFGILLVEILTGKDPQEMFHRNFSLADYFVSFKKRNDVMGIVHPRVMEEASESEIEAAAELALKCLVSKGDEWPTMREVTMELRRIRYLVKSREIDSMMPVTTYQNL